MTLPMYIGDKECTPTLSFAYIVCAYTKYCLYNIGEKECTPTLFVPHWLLFIGTKECIPMLSVPYKRRQASCVLLHFFYCHVASTEYYCIEHTIQLMLLYYTKLSTPTYVWYVEGDDDIKCD